ncbi:hypothetical protein DB30_01352 [Enhygromyxa salina]|uniref:Uncharacterized protein n=1 Tax=Enhygromyxa salina TaxID=215803 RepID=A0A0C2A4F0_9BACT|nr:hypothetical protein DB30_01352 [Enhygromyxa salina]
MAMSASLGVAWWLWTYDPPWPWTTGHAAIPGSIRARASHLEALAPLPTPTPEEGANEMATTTFFVKGNTPEKTEILAERPEWMAKERDDDAPVAYPAEYEDQLQTTPNKRAGTFAPPAKLPRY